MSSHPLIDLKVMSYQLEEWKDIIDVRLERMAQDDGSELWAIREGGACLNKQGEWEFEPLPSSRTKAFFRRCRFKSAEEAVAFWRGGNHKSRFERYQRSWRDNPELQMEFNKNE